MNPKTNPPGEESRKVIEVIPPRSLKAKAPMIRADLKDALRRAEDAIVSLAGDYDQWIRREDGRLQAAFREAEAAPDAAGNMARIAHDMKGLGSTFGYPLMSIVCDGLCRFLEDRATLTPKELDVVRVHLDAVALILKDDIRDDRQPGWAEIIKALAKVETMGTSAK